MTKKNEKSILITANTSWYLFNFRRSTISALIDSGYRVTAIAGDDERRADIEALGASFKKIYLDSNGMNPLKEGLAFSQYLFQLLRDRPGCILTFTPKSTLYCGVAAELLGIPYVINISGLGVSSQFQGTKKRILLSLYRFVASNAHHVFFQNKSDQRFLLEEAAITENRQTLIPGSGVNLNEFYFHPRTPSSKVRFGFFSRLLDAKGISLFIDAAKHFQTDAEFKFVVAGKYQEGRCSVSLAELELLSDQGVIEWLGDLSDVRKKMADSDCIVLPSLYAEGTPRTLIEAAALGCAIITTNRPGCQDTVAMGNGFLMEEANSEALIETMTRFQRLSAKGRNEMHTKSRKLATSIYDERTIIEAYLKQVEQALT